MKTETVFDIDFQDNSVHRLSVEDSKAIQALYENCLDFMLLVDGRAAGPNAGVEEFQDIPPGISQEDHFVFGIANQQDALIGLLDTVHGYPDETTWWIGLLLFTPEVRSQGLGQTVVEGFAEYVRTRGGLVIMLGVVEENKRAYEFWNRLRFEFVRKTEPRQFGEKTHSVIIMRRALLGE